MKKKKVTGTQAKEYRIYKEYMKLADKKINALQNRECKRVIDEIDTEMAKIPQREGVSVKSMTDKMTEYDKNKINCAMHKMFALVDIMEGAIIDFEQGLKTASGEPYLTIEVCSRARVLRDLAKSVIDEVGRTGNESVQINFANMAEEIEEIIEKYTLDNGNKEM